MNLSHVFSDRNDAGERLAKELVDRNYSSPVVLALPRGGVPVAAVVAEALDAPLDLILVRKIGVPHQPELALAAVVDGDQPEVIVNRDVRHFSGISDLEFEEAKNRELAEIDRRRALYLGGRKGVPLEGATAIVVDDGIATGATVRAALKALRKQNPGQLVLAVPVAPIDAVAMFESEVDELICLETPDRFHAIGLHYLDFEQVDDQEIVDLLARADRRMAS